jgi:hypothetical protein
MQQTRQKCTQLKHDYQTIHQKLLAFCKRDNPHIVLCSQIECTATTKKTIHHDNNNKNYLKIVGDNLGTSKQN